MQGVAKNSPRQISIIYTVSQNKTPMQSFCDNFGKYEPILTFCNELRKKVLYNPPPHLKSVTALPCEINCTALHRSYSIQKFDTSFIYNKYVQKLHVMDHMSVPSNLRYYSMCSGYPPSACVHALHCACHFVNGCVSDTLQGCAKHVAGAVAIYALT